jgi:hypothetical protein
MPVHRFANCDEVNPSDVVLPNRECCIICP